MLRAIILGCLFLLHVSPGLAQAPERGFDDVISEAKTQMMGDPSAAYEEVLVAEVMAREAGDRQGLVMAQWLQAEALNRMNRPGDAVPVLDQAIRALEGLEGASKLRADVLTARARTASALGDYATALRNFQSAHDLFLELAEERSRAIILLEMGNIHADARDFARAIASYKSAGEAYRDDPQIEISRLNNVATAHRESGDLEAAEQGFQSALELAADMGSSMLRARFLTNLAAVQLEAGKLDAARASADEARQLEQVDPSGWEPFVDGIDARIAFARGEITLAARLIGKAFEGQDLGATPGPFMEFHQAAAKIYEAAGEPDLALVHLQAFKRLDDQRRDISAGANTALLSARFDFASQELQIVRLRTETLEKEAALQAAATRQWRIIFGMTILLLTAMLVAAGINYVSMRRSRNKIRQANFRLSESNTALEKALKAKSEFLATTSHEIRTPLNAILGMSQLLGAQRGLAPEVAERVSLIHSSGLTMKAVVDDILDMSKIETGMVSVHVERCEVQETLQATIAAWRDRADAKGIGLTVDLSACPVRASTDERKLRQVVFNLVSNSIKFTETGEVTIAARLDETGGGSILEVTVADTGCGIPADKLDIIFEPFQQVDSSTTRAYSGTGLGLAISRKLAEALGGELRVCSTLGEGSVFTLRLPVTDAVLPGGAGDGAGAACDVLLFTPNPLHQAILASLLDGSGLAMAECETPAEASACLAQASPRALLAGTDALGGTSHEILETLLALSDQAGSCTIVLWMEEGSVADPAMLRLSGADAVLVGPFDAMAVLNAAGLQDRVDTDSSLSAA